MRAKSYLLIIFISSLLLQAEWLPAQEYPDLWRNSKTDDFYLIQKKFNEYYAGRDTGREYEDDEYTKFKRWEYFMEPRVYPSGKLINPAKLALDEELRYRSRTKSLSEAHTGNWQSLGIKYYTDPDNLAGGMGRVNCIVPHPADPQTLFAGTPAGGLWKTTDGGKNWEPLTDGLPVIGISGIAVNPSNPDSIYIVTGDGDGFSYTLTGNTNCTGVLLSTNGGDTWQSTGLQFDVADLIGAYKLLMHPQNRKILFAVTTAGIYKTTDGGINWNRVFNGACADLVFKPDDPATIYIAASNDGIYVSSNSGQSWTKMQLGNSVFGRGAIGVTPANPDYVYVLNCAGGFAGLFRSVDGGQTFTLQSRSPNILGWNVNPPFDPGSQCRYDLAIAISPGNAEEIHVGGVNCWKSVDGGLTWNFTSYWESDKAPPGKFVHADIHSLVFNDDVLYCGNDGGVSKSMDHAGNWTDISYGLEITQFHRIGVMKGNLETVYGGAQDNGVNKWTYPNTTMEHEILGDGTECVIDYTDENIAYALTANHGFIYVTTNAGSTWNRQNAGNGYGAWVSPLIMHPTDHTTLYTAGKTIFKLTDLASREEAISPQLPGIFNFYIALAMSAANPSYMYAATSDTDDEEPEKGTVTLCTDINSSPTVWKDITGALPVDAAKITAVEVSALDASKVWVSFSGYSGGNKVYQTFNAGKTWTNVSGSLPNVPVNCIVYHNNGKDGIYIGTDIGVFYKDNTLSDWIPFRNGMPNVVVTDLKITGTRIRAATYGRGIWESDVYGNCELYYTLSGDVTGFQFFEAGISIISTANIKGGIGTSVQYKAARNIMLSPGFKVLPQSTFRAYTYMGNCSGTQVYQRKYRGIYEGMMPGVRNKKKAGK